jgi:hypothetical protein
MSEGPSPVRDHRRGAVSREYMAVMSSHSSTDPPWPFASATPRRCTGRWGSEAARSADVTTRATAPSTS